MKTKEDLRRLLRSIDHKGYPAYKDTKGQWSYGNYILSIDHVQGDPFASPSSVSVIMSGRAAGIPADYYTAEHRRIALQDHLLRLFALELGKYDRRNAGSGKSGLVQTSRPSQEILERTACRVKQDDGSVIMRFSVGFPAAGRTILAGELLRILDGFLPEAAERSMRYQNLDQKKMLAVMYLADDQYSIREQLKEKNLCAFVADDSVLPRQSGVSSLPMKGAVPFVSPEQLAVTLRLPHRGMVRGMGIPNGVTLIVGGGYHGKSTLLQALERGVYNHIRGDGREYVITESSAVKIRAEDGRSIAGTDISMFINDLPNGKDTVCFSTEDASGSTSQAANVSEAMEAGTRLLLIDEDTSATNFMVRDELMARVVSKEKEPITPFISRVRDLYEKSGISTILVAGSSGAFFHVADRVVQMDRYVPKDITKDVRTVLAGKDPAGSGKSGDSIALNDPAAAVFRADNYHDPDFRRFPARDGGLFRENRIKLKTLSEDGFLIAGEEVDLRGLEQITDREQTAALSYILKYMQLHFFDGKTSMRQAVDKMMRLIREEGLEQVFDGACAGMGLAGVRKEEVFGMLNRYRRLKV